MTYDSADWWKHSDDTPEEKRDKAFSSGWFTLEQNGRVPLWFENKTQEEIYGVCTKVSCLLLWWWFTYTVSVIKEIDPEIFSEYKHLKSYISFLKRKNKKEECIICSSTNIWDFITEKNHIDLDPVEFIEWANRVSFWIYRMLSAPSIPLDISKY